MTTAEERIKQIDLEKWVYENCVYKGKHNSNTWCLSLFRRKVVLPILAERNKELGDILKRLEQPRAGSVFTGNMEFGMRYILKKILGLDRSEMLLEAKKRRVELIKRIKTMKKQKEKWCELLKLLQTIPKMKDYVWSSVEKPYLTILQEHLEKIEGKLEDLKK